MTRSGNPIIKLAIEVGPLLAFFIANARANIFVATGTFMVATMIALAAAYWFERRLPVLPLVTGIFVLVFGGLTLWLQDETFIKLKPTIVNALFAAILAGGMLLGRPLLRPLLSAVLPLTGEGWGKLTWRWAGFFLFLALFNEVTRHLLSTDMWVNTKVFATLPITIVFSLAQAPLLRRYRSTEAEAAAE